MAACSVINISIEPPLMSGTVSQNCSRMDQVNHFLANQWLNTITHSNLMVVFQNHGLVCTLCVYYCVQIRGMSYKGSDLMNPPLLDSC